MNKKMPLFPLFLMVLFFATTFPGVALGEDGVYPVIFEAVNKATLSAERAGVLTGLSYDVGASAKKGSTLGKLDTGELALRKKRSQLSFKHLSEKVKNLERLIKKGLATNEEISRARLERDVVRTDIDILKRQIGKSRIRAPFACVVVRRLVQPHEWVTAGQPVIEVVDPKVLRAVANIPSKMAVELKVGDTHDFMVHDLNATVAGKVKAVAPQVDELSNTAQVIWSVSADKQKLLSGMKGEVSIGK